MDKLRIGIALTGSFCTLTTVLDRLQPLREVYELFPIMSPIVYGTDTRFGAAAHFRERLETLCGREVWHTIPQVEPIGPKNLLDCLLIAPCTANTLAKLAMGVSDTAVTMAAKSTLRNDKPILLALSTNDALGTAAVNIGGLLNRRNLYFVPFSQDDHEKKPRSMAARFGLCEQTMEAAMEGRQAQPIIL